MNTPPFEYDIVIARLNSPLLRIDWGSTPNWMRDLADELNDADQLWLVPKKSPSPYKSLMVDLRGGKRWIIFSRVFGQSGNPNRVRLYAIGWQMTVGDANVKSIMWVYPSGEIECAEEPSYWRNFLK